MLYKRLGNYKDGFKYVFFNNEKIKDDNILQYIKDLKIPPAYNDVIIINNKKSKILAYGYDSKNRKQVIYNPDFIKKQSEKKFKRYLKMRKTIKIIKNKINKDITSNDIKNKEIAIILFLLIECGFRIGNDKYLKENKSYGITTLEKRHFVFKSPSTIEIEFIGKKGIINKSKCNNKYIYNYIKNKKGKIFTVNSTDVNNYLKDIDNNITSKDLRTWNANEMFLTFINQEQLTIKEAINKVAEKLHNTSNVCKKNYLDPKLIQKFLKK
jgi:DNA topoisomerase-1